jgi:hypothetical protein
MVRLERRNVKNGAMITDNRVVEPECVVKGEASDPFPP